MLNISQIKLPIEKLRTLKVGLVYLFGSYAEGVAGKLSDIDIGIVFTDQTVVYGNTMEIYNSLYDIFCGIFGTGNLDIVFLERASLELNFDVISRGKVLFEKSPDFRVNFEHKIAMFYADFKPILNTFDRAVISRI